MIQEIVFPHKDPQQRRKGVEQFTCRLLVALTLLLALLLALVGNIRAAPPTLRWAVPKRIPGYPAGTESPYLVADHNRVVHAFHSQPVSGTVSIVYSQWDYEQGWTMPVDVLSAPRGEALVKGVWLDTKGIFHLIFAGGDESGGDIYYSRAPALGAGQARAWSKPKLIGKDANMFAAAMASDDRGDLFVFYGGKSDGDGLYEVYSRDGGDNWSEPVSIFLTDDEGMVPGSVSLLLDRASNLHITWSVWRPPFGAIDIYYARLNANSKETTIPVLLDSGGADTPVIIDYKDSLLLVYATSGIAQGVAGKAMRQSFDGGRSWTKATWAFPPLVGGNGGAALVRDSSNNLYALLGNRTGDCCHGLWYSAWEGNRWSEPQAIVQGPKTLYLDPFSPQAVVSQGNIILATWWNESKIDGVWYTYAKLDVPELPLTRLPTPVPSPTATAIIPTDVPPTVKPLPAKLPANLVPEDAPSPLDQSPNVAIFLGVFPALALVAITVLLRKRH